MAHPQSNGQAERANVEIHSELKTCTYNCLKKHGAGWIDELPYVLWANQTSPSRATRETPFFMVYGTEAVLPPEIAKGSPRVAAYDEAAQDQLRHDDLDLLDERRQRAAIRVAKYHQALKRYHQLHVRVRTFQVGDLVLRRVLNREGCHKLSPSWEGPFRVYELSRPGCFHLATEDGTLLPNLWNIEHLRKFYL